MAVRAPMAGWIGFAAIMMLVIGSIDFLEGLIAVIRKHYFVVTPNQIVVFDTTTWGWLTLLWGIVLILAGLALGSGAGWSCARCRSGRHGTPVRRCDASSRKSAPSWAAAA